jgi:RNA recognition motif-containing protein
MSKRIQIGNLGNSLDDRDLAQLFAPHGAVHSAKVSTHYTTGRSTGVGFVEMVHDDEGESAIAALHGRRHVGQILSVCWSDRSPGEHQTPRMFKSMNIREETTAPKGEPERRGLP